MDLQTIKLWAQWTAVEIFNIEAHGDNCLKLCIHDCFSPRSDLDRLIAWRLLKLLLNNDVEYSCYSRICNRSNLSHDEASLPIRVILTWKIIWNVSSQQRSNDVKSARVVVQWSGEMSINLLSVDCQRNRTLLKPLLIFNAFYKQ